MSPMCPWLAVRDCSEESLLRALRAVAARAPATALPEGAPLVGSEGRWIVVELDVGQEISSWAQGISDELRRLTLAFLARDAEWGFDLFEHGAHVTGMDASKTPTLYGNVDRAAALLDVDTEVFERCHARRVADARGLASAEEAADPLGALLAFALEIGVRPPGDGEPVDPPRPSHSPPRWHGLLPKLEASHPAPRFEVREAGTGRKWSITLHRDRMVLDAADAGGLRTLTRDAFAAASEIFDGSLVRRTLVLRMPRPVSLKLAPPAFAALRRWLEPVREQQLAAAIRKRLRFKLGFGAVFLLMAATMWRSVGPVDPLLMGALGASALAIGIAARSRPGRTLFLLDGLWALGVAGAVTRWVAEGDLHKLWLAVVVFQMFHFMHGVRLYRFWGPPPDE